jgi:hypothetical protein
MAAAHFFVLTFRRRKIMIIRIDRFLDVRLESPEDFKRFNVQIDGPIQHLSRIQEAARAAGELVDTDTMWVSETWLRQAPDCADDPAWQNGVTAMINFARKHGWVRDGSGDIRAHVVWNAPPA